MENYHDKLIVVALGGNALTRAKQKGTIEEQRENGKKMAETLMQFILNGAKLIVTHGNGPQVGATLIKNEQAKSEVPPMPLDVCVADTEGSMGYILQQAFMNQFLDHNVKKEVMTIITQVLVDENDPDFQNPSKPVGPFYAPGIAKNLISTKQWRMNEDSGRGWRRVVPSPKPIDILQKNVIKNAAMEGHVVIAVGGGGIPVALKEDRFKGVEAVIDKDRASSVLASTIKADMFFILTEVPSVFKNFNKADQQRLKLLTTEEAKEYNSQKQFARGSMQPKIEAAIDYLEKGGKEVIITSPEALSEALEGSEGTRIVYK